MAENRDQGAPQHQTPLELDLRDGYVILGSLHAGQGTRHGPKVRRLIRGIETGTT